MGNSVSEHDRNQVFDHEKNEFVPNQSTISISQPYAFRDLQSQSSRDSQNNQQNNQQQPSIPSSSRGHVAASSRPTTPRPTVQDLIRYKSQPGKQTFITKPTRVGQTARSENNTHTASNTSGSRAHTRIQKPQQPKHLKKSGSIRTTRRHLREMVQFEQHGFPAKPVVAALRRYECKICNFNNPKGRTQCSMCGKPLVPKIPQLAAQMNTADVRLTDRVFGMQNPKYDKKKSGQYQPPPLWGSKYGKLRAKLPPGYNDVKDFFRRGCGWVGARLEKVDKLTEQQSLNAMAKELAAILEQKPELWEYVNKKFLLMGGHGAANVGSKEREAQSRKKIKEDACMAFKQQTVIGVFKGTGHHKDKDRLSPEDCAASLKELGQLNITQLLGLANVLKPAAFHYSDMDSFLSQFQQMSGDEMEGKTKEEKRTILIRSLQEQNRKQNRKPTQSRKQKPKQKGRRAIKQSRTKSSRGQKKEQLLGQSKLNDDQANLKYGETYFVDKDRATSKTASADGSAKPAAPTRRDSKAMADAAADEAYAAAAAVHSAGGSDHDAAIAAAKAAVAAVIEAGGSAADVQVAAKEAAQEAGGSKDDVKEVQRIAQQEAAAAGITAETGADEDEDEDEQALLEDGGAEYLLMTDAELLKMAMEVLPPPNVPESARDFEAEWNKIRHGMVKFLGLRIDVDNLAAARAQRDKEEAEGFVSYRLHVAVLGARHLAKADRDSDSDPYVRVRFNGMALGHTDCVQDSNSPDFGDNNEFVIWLPRKPSSIQGSMLSLVVQDADRLGNCNVDDTFLGQASVSGMNLLGLASKQKLGKDHELSLTLKDRDKKQLRAARNKLGLNPTAPAVQEDEWAVSVSGKLTISLRIESVQSLAGSDVPKQAIVQLQHVKGLEEVGRRQEAPDCYLKVRLGKELLPAQPPVPPPGGVYGAWPKEWRSEVVKDQLEPRFDQRLVMSLPYPFPRGRAQGLSLPVSVECVYVDWKEGKSFDAGSFGWMQASLLGREHKRKAAEPTTSFSVGVVDARHKQELKRQQAEREQALASHKQPKETPASPSGAKQAWSPVGGDGASSRASAAPTEMEGQFSLRPRPHLSSLWHRRMDVGTLCVAVLGASKLHDGDAGKGKSRKSDPFCVVSWAVAPIASAEADCDSDDDSAGNNAAKGSKNGRGGNKLSRKLSVFEEDNLMYQRLQTVELGRSEAIQDDNDPEWGDDNIFAVPCPARAIIEEETVPADVPAAAARKKRPPPPFCVISVFDEDKKGDDDFLGQAVLTPAQLLSMCDGQEHKEKLRARRGSASRDDDFSIIGGKVRFTVSDDARQVKMALLRMQKQSDSTVPAAAKLSVKVSVEPSPRFLDASEWEPEAISGK